MRIATANETAPQSHGEPSEARMRTIVIVIALLLLPPLLWSAYYSVRFPGLRGDALDYAQLGRNLAEGRGFSTYILRPLALTHGVNPTHQPDVTHGLLYPLVLAIAFGALGAKDAVVAGISGLFYLLTLPLLYLLGARLFNRTVGLLAMGAFAFSPVVLDAAISGLPITFTIFLMTALLLVLCSVIRRLEPVQAVAGGEAIVPPAVPRGLLTLAGVLTGALYLTNPVYFWMLPVVFGVVAFLYPARRISVLLAFTLPLLVLILPWMIRNGMLAGNPIFGLRGSELWMGTTPFPTFSGYRMLPSEVVLGAGILPHIVKKGVLGFVNGVETLPTTNLSLLLIFLLPSLLFRFSDPAANMLRRVAIGSFLAVFLGSLLFGFDVVQLLFVVPVLLVFAIAFLQHLWFQAQLSRFSAGMAIGLLILAVCAPTLRNMTPGMVEKPHPLPEKIVAEELKKTNRRPNEVVLSDQPWLVAWYADRPSLWIPVTNDKVGDLRKRFDGMRWLFLTSQAGALSAEWQSVYGSYASWNYAYRRAGKQNSMMPPMGGLRGVTEPLLTSLEGFTPVPPSRDETLNVVLAGIPAPTAISSQATP